MGSCGAAGFPVMGVSVRGHPHQPSRQGVDLKPPAQIPGQESLLLGMPLHFLKFISSVNKLLKDKALGLNHQSNQCLFYLFIEHTFVEYKQNVKQSA